MTQLDMAMIFNVSCSTIYACMKENGIKSTAHKPSKYNRELLIKYLQQGMPKERIAEIFNVDPGMVRSWIRRNHLKEYQKPQKKYIKTIARLAPTEKGRAAQLENATTCR